MADPLTVSHSLAGLLSLSDSLFARLTFFAINTEKSPKSIIPAIEEVQAINEILAEVGEDMNWSCPEEQPADGGLEQIPIDYFKTALTGCMLVLSKLEEGADRLEANSTVQPHKWAKEVNLKSLIQDLEKLKTSFSLMLAVIRCETPVETMTLKQKLDSLTLDILTSESLSLTQTRDIMVRHNPSLLDDSESTVSDGASFFSTHSTFRTSFERALRSSKVYGNSSLPNKSTSSLRSTLTASSVSLREVQSVRDVRLSVGRQDIWHHEHYLERYNSEDRFALQSTASMKKARLSSINSQLQVHSSANWYAELSHLLFAADMRYWKLYLMMIPDRQLPQVARLGMKILVASMRGNERMVKRRFRNVIQACGWFVTARGKKELMQRMGNLCFEDFLELVSKEPPEAIIYGRTAVGIVFGVVEYGTSEFVDVLFDVIVQALEDHGEIDQIKQVIDGYMISFDSALTIRDWMEMRPLVSAVMILVKRALKLEKAKALNHLMDTIWAVGERFFAQASSSQWIKDILKWEKDLPLLDSLLAIAIALAGSNIGDRDLCRKIIARAGEWFLGTAYAANRLDMVGRLLIELAKGHVKEDRGDLSPMDGTQYMLSLRNILLWTKNQSQLLEVKELLSKLIRELDGAFPGLDNI